MEQEMRTHIGADKNERGEDRMGYRNRYRTRNLQTRVGTIELDVPGSRDTEFQTDAFKKYRRAEMSLEKAMLEMYLSGVSTRKVADVTQALCGVRKSSSAQSDLNKRLYGRLKAWRERQIDAITHMFISMES
jgi:transposase-like protein